MCKIFQTITEPVTSINLNHMFVHGVNQIIIDWHKFRMYLVLVFRFCLRATHCPNNDYSIPKHLVRVLITHTQINYDLCKVISNGANTRRKQNGGKNAFHILFEERRTKRNDRMTNFSLKCKQHMRMQWFKWPFIWMNIIKMSCSALVIARINDDTDDDNISFQQSNVCEAVIKTSKFQSSCMNFNAIHQNLWAILRWPHDCSVMPNRRLFNEVWWTNWNFS